MQLSEKKLNIISKIMLFALIAINILASYLGSILQNYLLIDYYYELIKRDVILEDIKHSEANEDKRIN